MGDARGFITLRRAQAVRQPVEQRVKHWREFYTSLPEDGLQAQGARCMDCGVPFCQSDTGCPVRNTIPDRKSTRLNSSHLGISYAVFCLKKKNKYTVPDGVAARLHKHSWPFRRMHSGCSPLSTSPPMTAPFPCSVTPRTGSNAA